MSVSIYKKLTRFLGLPIPFVKCRFRPGSIVVVMNIVLDGNTTEDARDTTVESLTAYLSVNGILNYTTSNVTRRIGI